MNLVRMSGGGGETVKEYKSGDVWGQTASGTIKETTTHFLSNINDFTISNSGKMYLDVVISIPNNSDAKTITMKRNSTNIISGSFSSGRYARHFELDVTSGDRFTITSSAQPYWINGTVSSLSYRIV